MVVWRTEHRERVSRGREERGVCVCASIGLGVLDGGKREKIDRGGVRGCKCLCVRCEEKKEEGEKRCCKT